LRMSEDDTEFGMPRKKEVTWSTDNWWRIEGIWRLQINVTSLNFPWRNEKKKEKNYCTPIVAGIIGRYEFTCFKNFWHSSIKLALENDNQLSTLNGFSETRKNVFSLNRVSLISLYSCCSLSLFCLACKRIRKFKR
jgi:hypothetical protein